MKVYAPSYYRDFKCIAGGCKHNCCLDWEIDIDSDTLEFYNSFKGDWGSKFRNNIALTEEPHFILTEEGRCPFLNSDNLCEIICQLGENALCNICSDHPRFRNFYDFGVEIGLGLCCEAACDLILNDKSSFRLDVIGEHEGNEYDESFESLKQCRDAIFELLNESEPLYTIIDNINNFFKLDSVNPNTLYWSNVFQSLERLDDSWSEVLERLKDCTAQIGDINTDDLLIEEKNLLKYFIYRHFINIAFDRGTDAGIHFCLLSVYIIHNLAVSRDDIADIARMYSAEIEYSDENIDMILNAL